MCGFTGAELQHLPVIMPDNKKAVAALSKPSFCKYNVAIRVCLALIEKANIPTQELVLPGDGDKEIVVDMNRYQGDIFYSNFKHRANHTCSFNRGELSYAVGNKAPDTFSQHYCDYTNDLVQYGMVQKLTDGAILTKQVCRILRKAYPRSQHLPATPPFIQTAKRTIIIRSQSHCPLRKRCTEAILIF